VVVTDSTRPPNPPDTGLSYVPNVLTASIERVPVVTLRWPDESARRNELAAAGIPRLLLVTPGASPPIAWEVDEDWIAFSAPEDERAHRVATLRQRLHLVARPPTGPHCAVVIDEDGLARRDGLWVALSELEIRLVGPLLADTGHCVSRSRLLEAGWPAEERPSRAVDGAVRRLRAKLAPLGVRIHGITGSGYLLEVGAVPVR
jgi:DNA-binding winged helix-turn-helix (wHTH) protein